MKFTTKLVLPVLAISLISGSIWALNAPRSNPQPSRGEFIAVKAVLAGKFYGDSASLATAGIASFMAVEKFFNDNLPENTIAKSALQAGLIGYWIYAQIKITNAYDAQMSRLRPQQAINHN